MAAKFRMILVIAASIVLLATFSFQTGQLCPIIDGREPGSPDWPDPGFCLALIPAPLRSHTVKCVTPLAVDTVAP